MSRWTFCTAWSRHRSALPRSSCDSRGWPSTCAYVVPSLPALAHGHMGALVGLSDCCDASQAVGGTSVLQQAALAVQSPATCCCVLSTFFFHSRPLVGPLLQEHGLRRLKAALSICDSAAPIKTYLLPFLELLACDALGRGTCKGPLVQVLQAIYEVSKEYGMKSFIQILCCVLSLFLV